MPGDVFNDSVQKSASGKSLGRIVGKAYKFASGKLAPNRLVGDYSREVG